MHVTITYNLVASKELKDYYKKLALSQKQNRPNPATYQLAGEMLAAALRNYATRKAPYTIFGLHVIGMYVSSV
jgi:hypothetical protein